MQVDGGMMVITFYFGYDVDDEKNADDLGMESFQVTLDRLYQGLGRWLYVFCHKNDEYNNKPLNNLDICLRNVTINLSYDPEESYDEFMTHFQEDILREILDRLVGVV